jgi:hypothetical protein
MFGGRAAIKVGNAEAYCKVSAVTPARERPSKRRAMSEIRARATMGTEFACEGPGTGRRALGPAPVLAALALVRVAVGLPLRSPDR